MAAALAQIRRVGPDPIQAPGLTSPWEARCWLVLAAQLVPARRLVPAGDVELIADGIEVAADQGRLSGELCTSKPTAQHLLEDVLLLPGAALVVPVPDIDAALAESPLEVVTLPRRAAGDVLQLASPSQRSHQHPAVDFAAADDLGLCLDGDLFKLL